MTMTEIFMNGKSRIERNKKMTIKQYQLFKTAKKTAQENHLIMAENNIATTKTLFDFFGTG